MKKKTLPAMLPLCIAMLISRQGLALGLGSAELDSKLGSPLVARIPILSAQGLDADQLKVSLLSGRDARSDLALSNLESYKISIQTEVGAAGEGIIYLRSQLPLNEPFLDFVLSVRWPNGALQREYTLLLDIPTSLPASQAVQDINALAPPVTRSASESRPQAAPAASRGGNGAISSAARRPVSAVESASSSYYTVRGDTLWSIASRIRAARGGDQHAIMAQVFALNPSAFIRGNRNLLKESVALDIDAEHLADVGALGVDTPARKPVAAVKAPEAVAVQPNLLRREEEADLASTSLAESVPSEQQALETTLASVSAEVADVSQNIEAMTARLAELQTRMVALQEQYRALQQASHAEGAINSDDPALQGELAGNESDAGSEIATETVFIPVDSLTDNVEVIDEGDVSLDEVASVSADNGSALEEGNGAGRSWFSWLLLAGMGGAIGFWAMRKRRGEEEYPGSGNDAPLAVATDAFDDVLPHKTRIEPANVVQNNPFEEIVESPVVTAATAETDRRDEVVLDADAKRAPDLKLAAANDQLEELDSALSQMGFGEGEPTPEEDFDFSAFELGADELPGESADNLQTLRDRAAACLAMNDYAAAQRLLENALADDEDSQSLKMDLLDVYAHRGDVASFESLALQMEFGGADEDCLGEIAQMRKILLVEEGRKSDDSKLNNR